MKPSSLSLAAAMSVIACGVGCSLGGGGGAVSEPEVTTTVAPTSGGSEGKATDSPACSPHSRAPEAPPPDDPAVPDGAPSEFVSADTPFYRDVLPGEEEEEEEEEEREVQEGDIYRVLDDGYLLALSAYVGLEVIDIHDLAKPKITGRSKVSGMPIEMYVLGNRALVLMNNYDDYALTPGSIDAKHRSGGTGLLIDVSNRAAPRVLSQFQVPGEIVSSRLAHGGGGDSLYVAAQYSGYVSTPTGIEWRPETLVTSFDVGADAMVERGHLSLGGEVTAISAQANTLLVARDVRTWPTADGQVAIVDISASDGSMVLRDSVAVKGYVRSQFHMDLRKGILRVVSGPYWADGTASRLQTFAVDDADRITPIDYKDFSKGESIFGAVFLDDRAFAVTYYRHDPFHAFAIDPSGKITEKSKFIVSGWNDFFRPVLDASRLIGIGVDTAGGGSRLAVSLYDVTNLDSEKPLLARTVVESDPKGWNWSEAMWDHRAFTVLDDAVDVTAPTGERERGLVLLPFSTASAWWEDPDRSGVQIFTYSASTVTRRGVMKHPDAVRRAFRINGTKGANLSDAALTLQDQSDLDHPKELGRLNLAPDFAGIFAFGDYRVRIVNAGSQQTGEVIPREGPADLVEPVARFALPVGNLVKQVGDLLVTLSFEYGSWPHATTTITIVDLSCPASPRVLAPFRTDALPVYQSINTPDGGASDGVYVTPNAIALVRPVEALNEPHKIHACSEIVTSYPSCYFPHRWWIAEGAPDEDCSYWEGMRTCVGIDSPVSYCAGGFARCTRTAGRTTCVRANGEPPPVTTALCQDSVEPRRSMRLEVVVLDLTNPAAPAISEPLSTPWDEDGVSAIGTDHEVLLTTKQRVPGGSGEQPVARYFLRRVDLSVPAMPVLGDRINVPGHAIDAYGQTLVTSDKRWGRQFVETALARSVVRDDNAYLVNDHALPERYVDRIVIDDHRLALVSSALIWPQHGGYGGYAFASGRTLGILALTDEASTRGEVPRFPVRFSGPMTMGDSWWASLSSASHDRAFVSVPGGVLMLDLRVPTRPQAQAYFPIAGGNVLFDRDEILIPAGSKGIHQMLLDSSYDPSVHVGGEPIGADVPHSLPWKPASKKGAKKTH